MTELDFERARFYMVEQQIRTWEVLDPRVLDLISSMERHTYVPEQYRNLAYSDLQLPIGQGQVMLEPKLEARILQTLSPQPGETALEIGSGTGWMTACLAGLCDRVTSIDILPEFTELAGRNLQAHGVSNVELGTGDAAQGWDDGRRYDAIAVTASLPEFHEGFHQSLTIGGRLVLIVGEPPIMEGLLITRVAEDQWSTESLFDVSVPPLINAHRTQRFAL